MLPEWLDVETLRPLSSVGLVGVVVAAFLVARFVQALMLKAVALAVLAALGVGLWFFRADLGDCWETCNCHLLSREIAVPENLRTCP